MKFLKIFEFLSDVLRDFKETLEVVKEEEEKHKAELLMKTKLNNRQQFYYMVAIELAEVVNWISEKVGLRKIKPVDLFIDHRQSYSGQYFYYRVFEDISLQTFSNEIIAHELQLEMDNRFRHKLSILSKRLIVREIQNEQRSTTSTKSRNRGLIICLGVKE